MLDRKRKTYWATDDGVTTPELVLDLGKPVTFNVVSLREYLPLGQRVEAFALDQFKDGQWVEFAKGTSIGNLRLVRGDYLTTDKVRLRITQAAGMPRARRVWALCRAGCGTGTEALAAHSESSKRRSGGRHYLNEPSGGKFNDRFSDLAPPTIEKPFHL